jgi:uncharacterized phage protein (TIGR01671 family)
MREIKFRVWDTLKEQMVLNAHFCFDLFAKDQIRYIFQQYTGLKDKDGREIYEGDVLKATDASGYKYEPVEIKWEGNGFWLVSSKHNSWLPNQEYREIIGNIYENVGLVI